MSSIASLPESIHSKKCRSSMAYLAKTPSSATLSFAGKSLMYFSHFSTFSSTKLIARRILTAILWSNSIPSSVRSVASITGLTSSRYFFNRTMDGAIVLLIVPDIFIFFYLFYSNISQLISFLNPFFAELFKSYLFQ
ncbi:unnamed protein product [Meloidogyne enterolobii]|uniref:Uncharacterized protein n=1 Tax=Meloidogyne enterolobii TaxID=390850 RepID=A0ACB0Y6Z2_MELEN